MVLPAIRKDDSFTMRHNTDTEIPARVGLAAKMFQKRIEALRRLIDELSAWYGPDDVEVRRLQTEMNALAAIRITPAPERRKPDPDKRNFQSQSRQRFDGTESVDRRLPYWCRGFADTGAWDDTKSKRGPKAP